MTAPARPVHTPVLLAEVLQGLAVRPDGLYVDCTVGDGGHAEAILRAGGRVWGLDKDPEALVVATARLASFGERVVAVHASFAELAWVAAEHSLAPVDGVLFDLGLSTRQIELSGRGFSFLRDEPLDMRFDPQGGLTAEEVVNTLPPQELADLLRRYGEEPRAAAIARAIVRRRPFRTAQELVQAVESATGPRWGGRIHPATRVFQALRIYVNGELEALEEGLRQALDLLAPNGRLAAIGYHSLEDRIVKEALRREATDCLCPPGLPQCVCGHRARLALVTRRPLRPDQAELEANPRSRSARLRVARRLPEASDELSEPAPKAQS